MADDMTSQQWLLDSTGTKRSNGFFCLGFTYIEYTTNGHKAVVTDAADRPIITLIGDAADADVTKSTPVTYSFNEPIWIRGLKIPTLDSGKLLVTVV